jgi:hypothetical protein
LVILSATIHADRFVKYFESALGGLVWHRDFQECHKSFGYECIWPNGPPLEPESAIAAVADKVVDLLRTTHDGGILAFLPGEQEIKGAIDQIVRKIGRGIGDRTEILPFYSALEQAEIERAKSPAKAVTKHGETFIPRRVVIATNMGETSLTFPDLVHVVDSGLIKESFWDPATRAETLPTQWHSQAGCRQRWGRAGRNRAGFVYPLYTKDQFDRFEPFTRPAIEREALDDALIKATRAGVTDFQGFEWLDRPAQLEIDRVKAVVGARRLVDQDGDPTALGSEVFDLYDRIGRFLGDGAAKALDMASLLILADRYGCLVEAVTFLVLLPHIGDALYRRRKGLFVFDSIWSVAKRDRVARTQASLRAGCNDDLDLALKVTALYEGLVVAGRTYGGKTWADECGVNSEVVDAALQARDDLLGAFVRNARDRGVRALDLELAERVRLLVAHAWPDKQVSISAHGSWRSSEAFSGTLSRHTLANEWPIGTAGVVASFGRALDQHRPAGGTPVASALVRLPREMQTGPGSEPIAIRIHAQRELSDRQTVTPRMIADQKYPVGKCFPAALPPEQLVYPEAALTYDVRHDLSYSRECESCVSIWESAASQPVAVLSAHPIPSPNVLANPGDSVAVTFVRTVSFPPDESTSDFVCRTATNAFYYVAVQDLSISPWNPSLNAYVGTDRSLTYIGSRTDGSPILSQLHEVERSWAEIRQRSRYWGTVTSVDIGEDNSTQVGIQIQDPADSKVCHAGLFFPKAAHARLGEFKPGDAVYYSFRTTRESSWAVPMDRSALIQPAVAEALKSYGISIDGDQCRINRRLTSAEMYRAILGVPEGEHLIRKAHRVTHFFDIDNDSIDTDASLAVASALLEDSLTVWDEAWTKDRASIRERIKALRASLGTAASSYYCARLVRAVLDGAWKIQDLRYQTEERAAKASRLAVRIREIEGKHSEWIIRTQTRIANLSEWSVTNHSETKRREYSQYLAEAKAGLAKGKLETQATLGRMAAELREIERDIPAAKAELGKLRAAGRPVFDLSGRGITSGRSSSVSENSVKSASKQSTGRPSAHIPKTQKERRVSFREDQIRTLSARKSPGFLRTILRMSSRESIIEEVSAASSVTIDVLGRSALIIRGPSEAAIMRAERTLRERLGG